MTSLDDRKVRILQAIVNDYVATTRPVGSERLIEVYNLGCKSATVRNEMADLAELGYIQQPHTSAGRIPTDQGYRYYVDKLMAPPARALAQAEVTQARERYARIKQEVDDILAVTCRMLSQLTSCASLATDPSTSATTLRRIYLSGASNRHILLVALLSTGHVEHRLVEVGTVPSESELAALAAYVNGLVGGQPLDEIARYATPDPAQAVPGPGCLAPVLDALRQVAADLAENRILIEGTYQFLRQPEFKDVQRLETLLNALEQRSALHRLLRRTRASRDVTIIIGAENDYTPMQECSVVSSSYRISGRHAGYLGVVGPTRMNYDRAAAAVMLMARSLSQALTDLSMA